MTALPHVPRVPLTVAQYAAMGEDDDRLRVRYELEEGSIVVSPRPTPDHSATTAELLFQLRSCAPDALDLLPDLDVDLELGPSEGPGFVRRPDLVVARRTARQRVREQGGLIKASEVVLVVQIVSPSSKRTDNVTKRSEYADAGIPYYWIVDLDSPISLVACHLTQEFGYQDSGAVTGEFHTTTPFDVRIDLTKLG